MSGSNPKAPGSAEALPGDTYCHRRNHCRNSANITVDAMMKVTGWQQHSVRGFLAGVVKKRLKLKLGSAKVDGVRVYRVANGQPGQSGPRQI